MDETRPPEEEKQPEEKRLNLRFHIHRAVEKIQHCFVRAHKIVNVIEPWGILFAVVALVLSVAQFWLEYGDRVEERQVRAWQLVTTKAPGNSGKIAALEYLNKEDGVFCYEWLQDKLNWWHSDDNKGAGCVILLKSRTPLIGIDLSPSKNDSSKKESSKPLGVFLIGINLRHAVLVRANLQGALLTNADLRDANLRRANLISAFLIGANLRDADLRNANLRGANLRNANLIDADLRNANLRGANLRNANLIDSNLSDANLSDANLSDANLSDANLSDANLIGAKLNRKTLESINIKKVNLTGVDLSNTDLKNMNLSNIDLTNANLYRANLTNATLASTNLTGADLTNADLRGADLRGAELKDADLRDANLSRAHNLHLRQLDSTCGDEHTKLPKGLTIKTCK